jgi:acyl-CoA reductase-like NAD-dependent aldehyde dehydrogenase
VCTSSKRIYVERPIAAEFTERMLKFVALLKVGNPMSPDTDLGPLISHEAARRVEDQIARGEGWCHP